MKIIISNGFDEFCHVSSKTCSTLFEKNPKTFGIISLQFQKFIKIIFKLISSWRPYVD